MNIFVGRYRPPHQRVSIVRLKTNQQLQFDGPEDLIKWLDDDPEMKRQICDGEWVWTTQEVQGGH